MLDFAQRSEAHSVRQKNETAAETMSYSNVRLNTNYNGSHREFA